jgi:hemolysin III
MISTKSQTTVTRERSIAGNGGDMPLGTVKTTATAASSQSPAAHVAEDLPEAVTDGVAQVLGKPRARGWIHVYAAAVAIIAGAALVSV